MQPSPESLNHEAPHSGGCFTVLLQTHMVARRALRRMERLCEQFPDPALRAAVEALRREEDGWEPCPGPLPSPDD
jgi:hypothetical protein